MPNIFNPVEDLIVQKTLFLNLIKLCKYNILKSQRDFYFKQIY